MNLSLERNILEDVSLGRVPGGFYDTETPVGKFAEGLYLKGYIAGRRSRHEAVFVEGLTEFGKQRLDSLKRS